MYKYCITRFSAYILFGLCLILSSCGTRAPRVDYRELARAATIRNYSAIPTPSGRKIAEKYLSASCRKVTWCFSITDGVNASPIT